jgi:predicted DNA-binding protein (MmcQ/YjbR family)
VSFPTPHRMASAAPHARTGALGHFPLDLRSKCAREILDDDASLMVNNGTMTVRFHPAVAHLADFALSLPEAWADSPWGDAVVKVGKKIFVFASGPTADEPGITVKLPESRDHALSFPGSVLPGYGLGKHGWITVYVDQVPTEEREVLEDFVEESYRTVATKTLVKRLDAERAAGSD